jgi:hypothetical protein
LIDPSRASRQQGVLAALRRAAFVIVSAGDLRGFGSIRPYATSLPGDYLTGFIVTRNRWRDSWNREKIFLKDQVIELRHANALGCMARKTKAPDEWDAPIQAPTRRGACRDGTKKRLE